MLFGMYSRNYASVTDGSWKPLKSNSLIHQECIAISAYATLHTTGPNNHDHTLITWRKPSNLTANQTAWSIRQIALNDNTLFFTSYPISSGEQYRCPGIDWAGLTMPIQKLMRCAKIGLKLLTLESVAVRPIRWHVNDHW